jgi:hypothetical protein
MPLTAGVRNTKPNAGFGPMAAADNGDGDG